VVVNAINKARNISTLVRTNNQPFGRLCCHEKCHYAVTIIICPVQQIVNIASILSNESHILNIFISLHSETGYIYVSVSFLCNEKSKGNLCACLEFLFCLCNISYTICVYDTGICVCTTDMLREVACTHKIQWYTHN
jgi:hypothetical protein